MIVRAEYDHIRDVICAMRADDLREIEETCWARDHEESLLNTHGVRVAVVHDGKACAVMGVVPIWPNVGQAWLIGTDEIGNHGVEVAHAAKRVIKTLLDLEMHRIHAYSAAFHTQAHQWLEMIGFRRESTLKQYGKTGEDFYLYAITRTVSQHT